jgi:bacterioferritin-associated ferredoxin
VSDKVLICRCEDVTLAELHEAVERGYDDLESVKRLTGFGTGWCQGKQCVAAAARALIACGGQAPDAPITPRPPYHPLPVAHLAALTDEEEPR